MEGSENLNDAMKDKSRAITFAASSSLLLLAVIITERLSKIYLHYFVSGLFVEVS